MENLQCSKLCRLSFGLRQAVSSRRGGIGGHEARDLPPSLYPLCHVRGEGGSFGAEVTHLFIQLI